MSVNSTQRSKLGARLGRYRCRNFLCFTRSMAMLKAAVRMRAERFHNAAHRLIGLQRIFPTAR